MRKYYFLIFVLSLLLCGRTLNLKANGYVIKSLTTLNGLSQNDVQCLFQDSQGFVWAATNDGLNRYDGYIFKTYGINDSGLTSNLILAIDEDSSGNLWIGTADKGVFFYDREKDAFTQIELKVKEIENNNFSCRKIIVDSDDKVWFYDTTIHKIYTISFDLTNYTVSSILSSDIQDGTITDILEFDSSLLVATNKGIYRCCLKDSKLELTRESTLSANEITSMNSYKILVSGNNSVYTLDMTTHKEKNVFSGKQVRTMIYKDNRLYFTTSKGVFTTEYDLENDIFNSINCIYEYTNYLPLTMLLDRNNALWIGCLKNGILFFYHNLKPIDCYKMFGNNHISRMCKTPSDKLYIGTEGSGLYLLNLKKKNIEHLPFSENKIVYAVTYSDYKKQVYAGVQSEGVYSISTINKSCERILDMYDVRTILSDGKVLWIGTYNSGVYRYNIDSKKLYHVLKQDGTSLRIVRNFLKDYKGNIWIATDKGLWVIKAVDRFMPEPVLSSVKGVDPSDYIIPMYEDNEYNIWYGTLGRGLKKITKISQDYTLQITSYTTEAGLSSNTIKGILQDERGYMWISTNKGINSLNPATGDVRILDVDDGLQDYEFNELSALKQNNGKLMFGGVNGINSFNPLDFKTDSTTSIPVLTDFKLFNVSVKADSLYSSYFNKNISQMKRIEVPYNWNSFTFIFSALNYANPQKISYAYMLEGVDKDWVQTDATKREASYTKLSQGEYVFKLKASNADKVWNSEELSIIVVVNPPFWLTWYAYIMYALLLLFILYRLKVYYVKRIQHKNAIYIANFEKKKSEELLEMKTNFFSNISHELRTPLTLIHSPLQMILDSEKYASDKQLSDLLQIMKHNSNLLMKLVNELLSFSKNESGKLKLNMKYGNFSAFSKGVFQQFSFLGQQKEIQLDYSVSDNNINLFYDPYLMEQVVYNLLSNAIKHTPKGGFVSFSVVNHGSKISFSVSDSGNGISTELQPHLFERFYSDYKNINEGGTGIGLFLTKKLVEMHDGSISFVSIEGKGTIFTVELPIHIKENEHLIVNLKEEEEKSIVEEQNEEVMMVEIPKQEDIETERSSKLPLVMVVDDNQEICIMLTSLLSDTYNVKVAYDGTEAWQLIPNLQPDLIISDIMMPQMNGLQLCEKIKSDEKTSHIPVILLTAKSTEQDYRIGYHFQADGYCIKPFNNSVLKEMINSILNNRKRIYKLKGSIIVKPSDVTTTSTDEKFLQKLIKIVEDNVSNSDFQVDDLCGGVGVTSLTLNKKLKALMGTTANAFIRSIRLKRAANLLRTGHYSVSEVTYDVGFNDLKYFRDCFKKEFGMLPQQYKDGYCKQNESEENLK